MDPSIILTRGSSEDYTLLKKALSACSKWLLLGDQNTLQYCEEKFTSRLGLEAEFRFTIQPGEQHKTLDQIEQIYEEMMNENFDRRSAIVNLGGGLVCDMGGFAAATFKRGIQYYNVPTSLLAMVDASFGGKTGVNFSGLKNQIGAFHAPSICLVDPTYLSTLPQREVESAFAEIMKHALISDTELWSKLKAIDRIAELEDWQSILEKSIGVKSKITKEDPLEQGRRKVLNFGHSIGHALESHFNKDSDVVPHGFAVAAGMICESYISNHKGLLSDQDFILIRDVLMKHFEKLNLTAEDIDQVLFNLKFDKKNQSGKINLSLITGIGEAEFDHFAQEDEVRESLIFYINA